MKKLYLLLLMFSIFALPSITTQAALTPPTIWDYGFFYNGTNFVFSDGTTTYTPEFTRTADGVYWNYTWTGDANGLLPFEITLTFNRSNTSWTLGTTGYIATDTKIGSDNTTPATISKVYLKLNNTTDDDYFLYLDRSSDVNTTMILSYNSKNQESFGIGVYSASNPFVKVTSFAQYQMEYYNPNTLSARYFDAFYLENLGTSPAVQSTTAYESGYDDGFGDGYLTGVAEDNAYAIGYAKGLIDGGDMETGSSILIFVVAAIGFIMMIFGFTTRRGIFNLLSVGAFVVLGAMLAQYIGFIIIAIGLVIINVYYAFWGDL